MQIKDYKELAAKIFCYGAFAFLGLLALKYAFGIILPFLIAWGVGNTVYPVAKELSARTKMPRKVCSALLLALFVIIIFLILFLCCSVLLAEAQSLLEYLYANADNIAKFFEDVFESAQSLWNSVPLFHKLYEIGLLENFSEIFENIARGALDFLIKSLGALVSSIAAGAFSFLPDALIALTVTLVACFYFAVDADEVNSKISSALPDALRSRLHKVKGGALWGLKKYLRAYLLIFLITFGELLVGFWIIGIDNAFLLAAGIAFVDFLPLLGTSAVLLPWGICLLLMKKYFLGVGILVILAISTAVRQAIEPKILGDSFGVHPLISLAAIYIGYRFFGFWGMVLLPIAVLVLISGRCNGAR